MKKMKICTVFVIAAIIAHTSNVEAHATIGFNETEISVKKGEKTIEVIVQVLEGTLDKDQVVYLEVTTKDGTAKANVDYKPIQIPITLTPSVTSVIVYIEILATSSANVDFSVDLKNKDPDDSKVTISVFGVTITITGVDGKLITGAIIAVVLLVGIAATIAAVGGVIAKCRSSDSYKSIDGDNNCCIIF